MQRGNVLCEIIYNPLGILSSAVAHVRVSKSAHLLPVLFPLYTECKSSVSDFSSLWSPLYGIDDVDPIIATAKSCRHG